MNVSPLPLSSGFFGSVPPDLSVLLVGGVIAPDELPSSTVVPSGGDWSSGGSVPRPVWVGASPTTWVLVTVTLTCGGETGIHLRLPGLIGSSFALTDGWEPADAEPDPRWLPLKWGPSTKKQKANAKAHPMDRFSTSRMTLSRR